MQRVWKWRLQGDLQVIDHYWTALNCQTYPFSDNSQVYNEWVTKHVPKWAKSPQAQIHWKHKVDPIHPCQSLPFCPHSKFHVTVTPFTKKRHGACHTLWTGRHRQHNEKYCGWNWNHHRTERSKAYFRHIVMLWTTCWEYLQLNMSMQRWIAKNRTSRFRQTRPDDFPVCRGALNAYVSCSQSLW